MHMILMVATPPLPWHLSSEMFVKILENVNVQMCSIWNKVMFDCGFQSSIM